jgi:hypothetical protein
MTANDLPVLGLSRESLKNGDGEFSARPDVYERQIKKLVRDGGLGIGRRQKRVTSTTLGNAAAVAYQLEPITFPLSEGVQARALYVRAVRGGRQYGLTLFVALDSGPSKTQAQLDAIRSTWKWK